MKLITIADKDPYYEEELRHLKQLPNTDPELLRTIYERRERFIEKEEVSRKPEKYRSCLWQLASKSKRKSFNNLIPKGLVIDHDHLWFKNGIPHCITSQPHGWEVEFQGKILNPYCEALNLTYTVSEKDSWYYPPSSVLVTIKRRNGWTPLEDRPQIVKDLTEALNNVSSRKTFTGISRLELPFLTEKYGSEVTEFHLIEAAQRNGAKIKRNLDGGWKWNISQRFFTSLRK